MSENTDYSITFYSGKIFKQPESPENLCLLHLLLPTLAGGSSSLRLISNIIIPSKLEVAPNALKMWDWTGVDGWMDGYPLDCYDY